MTHADSGFVLPVVLGIILIGALIAIQAATELGSTTLLATQRSLHQRAFESAERGIVAAMEQLDAGMAPPAMQSLTAAGNVAESTTVQTAVVARLGLPAGFSADRIIEQHYEIRSTGHGVRNSAVTVVQGTRQLQAQAAP